MNDDRICFRIYIIGLIIDVAVLAAIVYVIGHAATNGLAVL